MTTVEVRAPGVARPAAPHRVTLRGGRAPASRRAQKAPQVATRESRLRQLRKTYDEDARRVSVAFRAVLDGVAGSSLQTARTRMRVLDAAVDSGVSTVMTALDLVRAERPAGPRRVAKAALRRRRQDEKFWTKQLMQLVDLRMRATWIALDTPGLLVPTSLADWVAA